MIMLNIVYTITDGLSCKDLQAKPGKTVQKSKLPRRKYEEVFDYSAAARIKYNLRSRLKKTGSMYHGFYTLREIKVSNRNFYPFVFCEVKTHLVAKQSFATNQPRFSFRMRPSRSSSVSV